MSTIIDYKYSFSSMIWLRKQIKTLLPELFKLTQVFLSGPCKVEARYVFQRRQKEQIISHGDEFKWGNRLKVQAQFPCAHSCSKAM